MVDSDTETENGPRSRSHSRAPSINSADFAVNPNYYNMNSSDLSLLNTTSSSDNDQDSVPDNQQSRFDAVEYFLQSINASLSTLELDKSIVLQSQLSGLLNDKSKLLALKIDELQDFLSEYKARISEYQSKTIPSLVSGLHSSEKRILRLNHYMKKNHPIEYQKSKDKVLNRITDEDDDLYV